MLKNFKNRFWSPIHLSLRLKFIIVISLCLLITMTISIGYLGQVQANAFEQESRQRSELVANFGEANRRFVKETLRPKIETYTRDFVVEAMSSTYSTRAIFKYFNEILPTYLYRQPTLNPMNPIDQADAFESQLIRRFQSDHDLKEITGYRTFNNQQSFYVAKPIKIDASCLKCHWSPDTAPASLVQTYGRTNGYGWQVGEVVSALMIDVPTQDLRANQAALTNTVLITFSCLAIILTVLIYLFFDQLVNQRLRSMVKVMGQVSAIPGLKTRLADRSRDELGLLAQTFNRMANSLEVAYADLEQKVSERTAKLEQTLAQLQRTQGQMVQAEKMSSLGQLVAGVAHEINNPISFIYGNLTHVTEYSQNLLHLIQLYRQHLPNPPLAMQQEIEAMDIGFIEQDLTKVLHSMNVGTKRIQEIVLSLRNFSRLDEAECKAVDIHEGIDSTLMILQHRLKMTKTRPDIQVIRDYAPLPPVKCYVGQLNQVLMHLITNAIDALEAPIAQFPPTLIIRTAKIADAITIAISDNGVGMTVAVRSRIFDPFFTTKPIGKGTGLGLSISYQIITEQHQGKLSCHSAPGAGTEFVIEIPL